MQGIERHTGGRWRPDGGTATTGKLTRAAEVVSDVFDANVFRVALRVIALVYLIHGEQPRDLTCRHGVFDEELGSR